MAKVKGGRPTKSDKRASTSNKSKKNSNSDKSKKAEKSKALAVVGTEKLKKTEKKYDLDKIVKQKGKYRLDKKLRKTMKKYQSRFKDSLPDIYAELNKVVDGESIAQLHKMFLMNQIAMYMTLVPIMEDSMNKRGGESNSYGMNAITSQIREMFHDIRSAESADNVIDKIISLTIEPTYLSLAQQMLNVLHNALEDVKVLLQEKDHERLRRIFQENGRAIGAFLDTSRQNVIERLRDEIE